MALRTAWSAGLGMAAILAGGFVYTTRGDAQGAKQPAPIDCYCTGGEKSGNRHFIRTVYDDAGAQDACRFHENINPDHRGQCSCERRPGT